MKVGIIYKYVSPSGKIYIGKTVNERSRKNQHKSKSKNNPTGAFDRAIAKYGFENLEYSVLIRFKPTDNVEKLNRVLSKLEIRYIKLYNSNNPKFGYNLTLGGDGTLGYKYTEEMKQESLQKAISKGTTKTVYQFSKNKEYITSFPSINQAAKSIGDNITLISKRISEVCSGKWESAYNYIWSFNNQLEETSDYKWIAQLLEDREYSLPELREIFIPLLEAKGLKIRTRHFINDYFPEYTKKEKWVNGIRNTYYKFKI